jgi:hypothetical protein
LRQSVTAIDDELTAKAVEAAGEGGEVVSLLKVGVSIVDEFLSRWTALVPRLRELKTAATVAAAATAKKARRAKDREQRRLLAAKAVAGESEGVDINAATTSTAIVTTTIDANADNDDEDDEEEEDEEGDNEHVEQEGCPDENDFNKWSHHCSVQTCDDEVGVSIAITITITAVAIRFVYTSYRHTCHILQYYQHIAPLQCLIFYLPLSTPYSLLITQGAMSSNG